MIRKLTAIGLIALLPIFAACQTNATNPPDILNEDEPGWDCHTMGNRICGEEVNFTAENPRPMPTGTICWDAAMTKDCTLPPNCWEQADEDEPGQTEWLCRYEEAWDIFPD